jgi:adenosylmethionine-8-amino-7-oxononanoate aminotransferase
MLKKKHGQIAAFVVEPIVQGAAGMIMWPKGVLKRMRELCRRYEVIFIADEVATGFGRTGTMFACEQEGVSPDILCLAKGLTAGYLPLAATLTTQKIFDGFCFDHKEQKTFFHGHTYTGNPLACAAALANLEVFEKEGTLGKLAPKIKFLSRKLQMFYNLPHVGDVRQRGFMVGIELVRDRATQEPYPWTEKIGACVCQEVRKHGVILRPLGNVIVLMPPLSMSVEELERLLDVTYRAIGNVTGSG